MLLHRSHREDANTRVAAYESLLDLFTLVSLIMMLAAFVYMQQAGAGEKSASFVTADIAQRGSGAPLSLPKDTLLLVLSRSGPLDVLSLVNGSKGGSTNVVVTVETVAAVLNGLAGELGGNKEVDLAVHSGGGTPNPGIVVAVQHWLADHRCKKYRVYFSEEQR
jgi:hypothetical protein